MQELCGILSSQELCSTEILEVISDIESNAAKIPSGRIIWELDRNLSSQSLCGILSSQELCSTEILGSIRH
jgi:hypothetical protein